VEPKVSPVSDDLISTIVSAASNAHSANAGNYAARRRLSEAEANATEAAAAGLRELAYKASSAMGKGVLKGECVHPSCSVRRVVCRVCVASAA
jgi:hypothetical protein